MVSREFESLIQDLNHEFGLQLSAHHQRLTYVQATGSQDAQLGREVYHRLRHQHNNKHSSFLPSLDKFKLEAHRILKHWVHKPLADPDTLPSARARDAPLGARNASERAALYDALRNIMDTIEEPGPAHETRQLLVRQPRARPTKRVSNEHDNGLAKRPRAKTSSLIDDIPMGSQQQQTQPKPQQLSQVSHEVYSFTSASTSRVSIPSTLFSGLAEHKPTPFSSQDTTLDDRRKSSQEYLPSTAEQKILESMVNDQLWPPSLQNDIRPDTGPLIPCPDFGPRFEGIWRK